MAEWKSHDSVFYPLSLNAVLCCDGGATLWEKRVHGESIIQGFFKPFLLEANRTLEKPVLREAGDSELFLDPTFCFFTACLFSSIHLLSQGRREHPIAATLLCTQVLTKFTFKPVSEWLFPVTQIVSEKKPQKSNLAWLTVIVTQTFNLHPSSTNLPELFTHKLSSSNPGFIANAC